MELFTFYCHRNAVGSGGMLRSLFTSAALLCAGWGRLLCICCSLHGKSDGEEPSLIHPSPNTVPSPRPAGAARHHARHKHPVEGKHTLSSLGGGKREGKKGIANVIFPSKLK